MCGVSTINTDKHQMKRIAPALLILLFIFSACSTKDDPNALSNEDQKAVIAALFNASSEGMDQGMSPNQVRQTAPAVQNSTAGQVPLNNDFSFTYSDNKGGSILMTIDTGGYFNYSDNPFAFLGGFMVINIDEKITNFHVALPNGREVIISTNQDILFSGNFYINGDYSFDSAKSFLRIEGVYMANGIEYDLTLLGSIKSDGSCKHIGGMINGLPISFDY